LAPYILPVVAAEVAREGRAARAIAADLLLEARQFLERRGEHPGAVPGRTTVRCRKQPEHALAPPDTGLELKQGLDAIPPHPPGVSRWRPAGTDLELRGLDGRLTLDQTACDHLGSDARRDVPGEGQHITPVGVSLEQGRDGLRITGGQARLEGRQPLRNDSA